MSAILLNIGAVCALWGILWFAWDHNARAPIYLLGAALIALGLGAI